MCRVMSLTNSRNESLRATKSVSQFTFDEHAHLALQVDVGSHDAFLGGATPFAFGFGDAFFAQDRFGGFEVAVGFGQGAFAVHHARVGFVAQGFDELGINFGHRRKG